MTDKKGNSARLSLGLSELVQQEVNKILKGEQSVTGQVNFAHIADFAGDILIFLILLEILKCIGQLTLVPLVMFVHIKKTLNFSKI